MDEEEHAEFVADLVPEAKVHDVEVTLQVSPTGSMTVPAASPLLVIPSGTDDGERTGRMIRIVQIEVRGYTTIHAQAGDDNLAGMSSLFLVLDKQANGALPAVADVYSSDAVYQAYENQDNEYRFVQVARFDLEYDPTAGVRTAWNPARKRIRAKIPADLVIDYSGTTGALTEIRSNNLFLVMGEQGLDDADVDIIATFRFHYFDV